MKKIEEYTFNDFINDKSFIKWIVDPDTETDRIWNYFRDQYPDKLDDIRLASLIIESSASEHQFMNNDKLENLWLKIETMALPKKRKTRLIPYFAAAAGFLILISIGFWYYQTIFTRKQAFDYSLIKAPESADNKVQVILSDSSFIYLSDKEPTLMYQHDGYLQTNTKKIGVTGIDAASETTPKELAGRTMNQIIVPRGKRSSIIFSDGTKLWLNSGSRAIYPVIFHSSIREIFIEGEAFLEVYPDKSKPFVVKTEHMEVQITGTSFNIKAYPEEESSSIVLVEGSVKVKTSRQKEVKLQPDQMYSYSLSSGKAELIDNIDIFEHIGWKYGWMLCNGEPLGSVFKKLSRYYNIDIEVDDHTINAFKITGKLALIDTITDVMKAISIAGSVNYTFLKPDQILISNK